uniref:POP1 domain-containing protein n=1 Tax=Caenorhabditis japonica TaxID=281687 RepID=A0A8R1DI39_CAEJA
MAQKWGFKIADRSYQRGFRAVLRDSNKNCTIRDRSYYTCLTIKSADAYSKMCPFSEKSCRRQSSRAEEEECHQLYVPGKYPFGYIGPARFQKLAAQNTGELYVWIHPSSKPHLLTALLDHYQLQKDENSEAETYKNDTITVSLDAENVSRFHLSGPRCLAKLRDSVRLVENNDNEQFRVEHERFLSVSNSVFNSNRDGDVFYLLIEDPRTAWDRKVSGDFENLRNFYRFVII